MTSFPFRSAAGRHSLRRAFFAGFAAMALLGACSAGEDKSAAKAADKKKQAPPAVPVLVAAVETATVPLRLQAIGNVEPYATVAIKSRVDGQVVEARFRDGDLVKKGQPLFQIDPRPFEAQLRQAEATLARDKAQLDRARAQEKRYKELLEKGFVSQDAYAQFRTNVETAEATVRAGEAAIETARLQLEYCSIRSPIDGRTGKTLIQAGNMVKANDTVSMVTINQVSPIYLSFAVPEQHLGPVRAAMAKQRLAVGATPQEPGAATVSGTLAFIDNTVDGTTGTVRLRAVFDNRDGMLWPGQFATATLTLGEQQDAVVVPSQAIQTGPKGQYVYVVGKDMVAEQRPVTIDRPDGERTIIASGLAAGERVVISGQSRLTPKARIRIADGKAKS